MNRTRLTPLHAAYPSRLRSHPDAPASVTLEGDPMEADRTVAVVGSRAACEDALRFAADFCGVLARAGVVVVSGGAVGVDAAAHRASLDAAGRTWVVTGTSPDRCFPKEHAGLYDAVGRGPGAMLWPFDEGSWRRDAFLHRNGVLVALSDAVVVVQAGTDSGALNAARWARKLHKPLWVVATPPWVQNGFEGSKELIHEGARPLVAVEPFLATLLAAPLGMPAWSHASAAGARRPSALPPKPKPAVLVPPAAASGDGLSSNEATREVLSAPEAIHEALSPNEIELLELMSNVPTHLDGIAGRTRLPAQAIAAALLTLALENVVVEGPPGYFRRRDSW